MRVEELVHLALRPVPLIPVAFLDPADELLRVSCDSGQIVVSEPAPFRLHVALQLLPFPFQHIFIHDGYLMAQTSKTDTAPTPPARTNRTTTAPTSVSKRQTRVEWSEQAMFSRVG